jgi:hypothetical protein
VRLEKYRRGHLGLATDGHFIISFFNFEFPLCPLGGGDGGLCIARARIQRVCCRGISLCWVSKLCLVLFMFVYVSG